MGSKNSFVNFGASSTGTHLTVHCSGVTGIWQVLTTDIVTVMKLCLALAGALTVGTYTG